MNIINFPLLVFAFSLAVLRLSAQTGAYIRGRRGLEETEREDFNIILGATLTLLGLIIGFTFSMALTRYDQRKSCEEVEANAIGTEYDRAGLLPPTDATAIRGLLRSYLDQRVLFYTTRDERRLDAIKADTARLQNELWSVVQARATAQATPMIALTASGMNDGFNSRGYTEASWLNRIPVAAWALMNAIAVCCNLLIGYNAQRSNSKMARLFILPMVVAISFLLIADLDSPRGGVIRILPHTLVSISNFQDPQ